jgi:HPt (histidine-containing phosphotransfer) domain-containing protein
MGGSALDPLAEAMNRLWAKHLPQILERVETLHKAAGSLTRGVLSDDEQQRAAADAHRLAGVLGTFGLKEGTELAREAEALYEGALSENPVAASRLAAVADRLQLMIAERNRGVERLDRPEQLDS